MADDRVELALALAEVGRAVRAAVGAPTGADAEVVVDARADTRLVAELDRRCGARWPGTLVCEGFDTAVAVGDASGPWRYLADPVDGSRPWVWGKRSAWCTIGAGPRGATLGDLEVGACVELPTARTSRSTTACAVRGGGLWVVDDPAGAPVEVRPLADGALAHRFVTVVRGGIGSRAALGAWEDQVLGGLATYDDPFPSTGGLLMEVALGRQAAVLDPRPLVAAGTPAARAPDLAGWVVAAEAGVVVEALPPGPLSVPLDASRPVAWAAYANEQVASVLRPRISGGSSPGGD